MKGPARSTARSLERVEQWVCDSCRELGLPVESPSDDFFVVGGTSLTVVRLVARAEAEFGEDCLPPDDMYENSSLRGIAAIIVANSTADGGGDDASAYRGG